MEEKNSVGNLIGGFLSLAIASQYLSMITKDIFNEGLLPSNNNFFKNKYKCSIVKKDSLKSLRNIKRYY